METYHPRKMGFVHAGHSPFRFNRLNFHANFIYNFCTRKMKESYKISAALAIYHSARKVDTSDKIQNLNKIGDNIHLIRDPLSGTKAAAVNFCCFEPGINHFAQKRLMNEVENKGWN